MSDSIWTEVRVCTPLGWQELVCEALTFEPLTGVVFGRTSVGMEPAPEGFDWVRTFVESAKNTPELRSKLAQKLSALASATGMEELEDLAVAYRELPVEDYATSWKKSWKPFRVGRLVLLPPWDERTPRDGDTRLTLQPGGAFGSGRHATTRTCLRVISERISGGERVLDAGCGSGVLSVASLLLGAQSALGFDIHDMSVDASRELAEENAVAAQSEFRLGGFEMLTAADERFDVVLANIFYDVIEANAKGLGARLRPGGWFAFSGCPMVHRPKIEGSLERAGLQLDEIRRRGRWDTFVGVRPT